MDVNQVNVTVVLVGALVGALVGGCITGFFTLVGVSRTYKNDVKRLNKVEAALLQGFYRAVLTEIETLWTYYQETMGHVVESLTTGNPLAYYYPVTQDYFTVYRSNANLIGRIPNRRLREIIVKTYIGTQALVDSYKMNNELVARLEYWEGLFAETKNDTYQVKLNLTYKGLVDYADGIRKRHYQLKTNVESLISALKDDIKPD